MLYDMATKVWRTLASQRVAEPVGSHTERYRYFTNYVQKDRASYRVSGQMASRRKLSIWWTSIPQLTITLLD